jgi:hypothetical protein
MLAPLKDIKKAADGPFSDGSRQPSLVTEHCVADPGCLPRICRLAYPHHFNADPDPTFHLHADPDPAPERSNANL